jgi:hypothetical protein
VEEHKEEENFISYEALGNILCDFTVNEFDDSETPLLITPIMTTLFQQLERSIQRNRMYESLLQGPSIVGKSTTLLYIGHMAILKGYMVFPIQARDFVNQAEPMSSLIRKFLLNWIDAECETKLKEITPRIYRRHATLWDILDQNFEDEKVVVTTFRKIVEELQMCATKPMVFLIDQCNAFHANPQTIKLYSDCEDAEITPRQNPVGAMF